MREKIHKFVIGIAEGKYTSKGLAPFDIENEVKK